MDPVKALRNLATAALLSRGRGRSDSGDALVERCDTTRPSRLLPANDATERWGHVDGVTGGSRRKA